MKRISPLQKLVFLPVLLGSYVIFNNLAWSKTSSIVQSASIESYVKSGGIQAELVDENDYYFAPDGSKVKLFRKKGVFVVRAKANSQNSRTKKISYRARVKAHYGDRVEFVSGHRLGTNTVVKINNASVVSGKFKHKSKVNIQPSMLKGLDSSIEELAPVFSNQYGHGDILLSDRLLVKLNTADDLGSTLSELLTQYNLSVNSKLNVSGDVYSLRFNNPFSNSTQIFPFIRSLMFDQRVTWAQPDFIAKPYKMAFTPNDAQFGTQWYLQNNGLSGSRCDADVDANDAWVSSVVVATGDVVGEGSVIAIIDDGVEMTHPDLQGNKWENDIELNGTVGVDDDGNGYIDDVYGWDFVDDEYPGAINASANIANCQANLAIDLEADDSLLNNDTGISCRCSGDSSSGPDNDPSPQAVTSCVDLNGENIEQDNHGTAVAGIAAAEGNNTIGIAGVAFKAEILPIRLVSEFDSSSADTLVTLEAGYQSFCVRSAEAMAYAGRYADVINNSWGTDAPCQALNDTIADVEAGAIINASNDSVAAYFKRPGLGTPVVFASGNSASGWVKVSVEVTGGEHSYEWRHRRSDVVDTAGINVDDKIWIDDITWPDGSELGFENFSTEINDFLNPEDQRNTCDDFCSVGPVEGHVWLENTDPNFVRTGGSSVELDVLNSECSYSYLHTMREGPAGTMSFWIWVSALTDEDKVEFLIDGEEVISYGDIASAGIVDNEVSLLAALPTTIAVGSSTSGDLSGDTTPSLGAEQRAPYSQYGVSLDIVAPSGDQQFGIVTTDRSGSDGYSVDDYTENFGGTSASSPMVAGALAAMVASNDTLSAAALRAALHDSADKIGSYVYTADRNDYFGYGRLNLFRALQAANAVTITGPVVPSGGLCVTAEELTQAVDPILALLQPQVETPACTALGPIPEDDGFCVPIKTQTGVAVICL